ncbi:vicilin-like [Cicer arietinum]|uniref:Provicilin n=1 Tax=Cicer arietinum TaxID=3827 RepID=Q304D4_CICAR|nr:vicilin-like [Cicer arietinum]CAA36188.1 provicilin precursor [Cicer arietinum]
MIVRFSLPDNENDLKLTRSINRDGEILIPKIFIIISVSQISNGASREFDGISSLKVEVFLSLGFNTVSIALHLGLQDGSRHHCVVEERGCEVLSYFLQTVVLEVLKLLRTFVEPLEKTNVTVFVLEKSLKVVRLKEKRILLIGISHKLRPRKQFLSSTKSGNRALIAILMIEFLLSFRIDDEIERVLLEEQEQKPKQRRGHKDRQQSQSQSQQEADVIVKISREQIEELSKNAKSSSKKSVSSESEPFNLRSRNPIYSNKYGNFFEITPEKNPQLQDLDISLNSVEINEGSLLLPHFNSRATVILVVNEGKGEVELVGLRNENEQENKKEDEEEEEDRKVQVQRFQSRLSSGDVVVIPATHPFSINASSDLFLLGFGINAQNNQRNFLAGEEDNVISQIQRPVKEVAFPGSAEEVDRLLKNQRQSHFANAQPQQKDEESQKIRIPLSSILGGF